MGRKEFLKAVEKKSEKLKASKNGKNGMWHYLVSAVSVGWLVVIPALGGVYLGRYLDKRWNTGAYWTLSLMVAGLVAGIFWIWYSGIRKGGNQK